MRVLLFGDNRLFLKGLEVCLAEFGQCCAVCVEAGAALAALDGECTPFDVVACTDPRYLRGSEVARCNIRTLHPQIPVDTVLSSWFADKEEAILLEKLKIPTVVTRIERVGDSRCKIVVEDEGDGFDYHALDMTLPEDPQHIRDRGYTLINAFCAEIEFNDKGNQVTVDLSLEERP